MHLRSFVYGVASAVAVSSALVFAQGQKNDDAIVALVNDEPITFRQLTSRIMDYHGEQTLEAMINRAIVRQQADKEKIILTDKDLDTQFDRVKTLIGGLDPARATANYRQWLAQSGITEAQHRDQMRYTLLQEQLVKKTSPVTNADLERLEVRVIACNTDAKCRDLLRRLRQRADFALLAQTESDDPNARLSQGLLPPFHRIQMPTMWSFANKLAPGEWSKDPIPARDGFVIIKLERRLPAATLKPGEYQELESAVKVGRMDTWLDRMKKAAKVTKPVPLKSLYSPPAPQS